MATELAGPGRAPSRREAAAAALRRRPFGVYAVAALLLLDAAALLMGAVGSKAGDALAMHVRFGRQVDWPNVELAAAGLIVAVVVGLLGLKRWAWVAVMVLIGVGLAVGIWLYASGEPAYVNMLINVAAVFYLYQRDVQAAFSHEQPPS